MGLLDEAIREHLDLKRQHGANEDELARQEAEALGPVTEDDLSGAEAADADAPGPEPEAGWPFDRDFSDTWAQQAHEPSFTWGEDTAADVEVPSFIPPEPLSDPPPDESEIVDAPTASFEAFEPGVEGKREPADAGEAPQEEAFAPQPSPEPPVIEEQAPPEDLVRDEAAFPSSGPETEFLPPPTPEPPAAEPPAAEPPDESSGPLSEPAALDDATPEPEPVEAEPLEPEPSEVAPLESGPERDAFAPAPAQTPPPPEPASAEIAPDLEQDHELPPEREPSIVEPPPVAEEAPRVEDSAEAPPLAQAPEGLDSPEAEIEPSLGPAPDPADEQGQPPVGPPEPLAGEQGPVTEVWSIHDEPGFGDAPGAEEPSPNMPLGESEGGFAEARFEGEPPSSVGPIDERPPFEPLGAEADEGPPREPPPAARGFFEETEEHEPLWREERPGNDPDFEN